MKKLIGFLTLALFYGCTCIGQLPDQILYVDENCEGYIPDYRLVIRVSDNCGIDTVIQIPEPGYRLDFTEPKRTVAIIASDVFGNETNMFFDVILLDTIPPVIIVLDTTLVSYVQGTYYRKGSHLDNIIRSYKKSREKLALINLIR